MSHKNHVKSYIKVNKRHIYIYTVLDVYTVLDHGGI